MNRLLPDPAARPATALAAAVLALALAGCADMAGIASHATMRDAASLGLTADAADPAVAAAPVARTGTQALDASWWLAFQDPQLDRLIGDAFTANPNL